MPLKVRAQRQFSKILEIMVYMPSTIMPTDSIGHSFVVNTTESALHSTSALLPSRLEGPASVTSIKLMCFVIQRIGNVLNFNTGISTLFEITPNIYYQSSSDGSDQYMYQSTSLTKRCFGILNVLKTI